MSEETRSITITKKLCGFGRCMREAYGYSTEYGRDFCKLHDPKIMHNVVCRSEDGRSYVETANGNTDYAVEIVSTFTGDYRFAARMRLDQAEAVVESLNAKLPKVADQADPPHTHYSIQVDARTNAQVEKVQKACWHPMATHVQLRKGYVEETGDDRYPLPIVFYNEHTQRVWVMAHVLEGNLGEGVKIVTDNPGDNKDHIDIDGNYLISIPVDLYVEAWYDEKEANEIAMCIDADDRLRSYM